MTKFKNCLIILFALTTNLIYGQEKYTISGTVSNAENGETMVGVTVLIEELTGVGVTCNAYGYYSITAPKGNYTLTARYVGCEKNSQKVELTQNRRIDIKLNPNAKLKEVVVTSEKRNSNIVANTVGVEKLDVKELIKIPVLMGEQDIIKTLTLTPGVKTTGEGSGGMFVRGGSDAQNLVLLDEATVYNTNHLFGFFSTFNSDAIKDLTLYKGTAPAQYGGRISSVMDVKMNDGNNQRFRGGAGIGLISSRANIEGPIVKDKGSFLISGRRTYADLLLRLFGDERFKETELYFYDLNAKVNYKINENNRIFLSGYFGRDVIGLKDRFGIDWGNITGTLRWNHIWNERLFSNTSFIYSDYDYKVKVTNDTFKFSLTSIIENLHLKHDFQYYLSSKNTLSFGLDVQHHTITPGKFDAPADSGLGNIVLQDRYGLENALFFSNDWRPNNKLNITYGLRLSSFHLLGPGQFYTYTDGRLSGTEEYKSGQIVHNYFNLEPRLNASYILNESSSLKFSYTRNTQNLHLIQNSTSSNPTDVWIASSNNVKPEIGDQVALGFFKNFKDNTYEFSSEAYYRHLQNQIDLKNGARVNANEYIEGDLLSGIGRSYGLEMMLKKKTGRFNGWLSYTLSRTERQIEGINQGRWYAARQDATHDVSVVGIYELNDKWSLSATWVYNTGNAITFPSGKYEIDGNVEFYYTERNGYRMPDYHRLDLGATRILKKSKNYESSLSFSLYNAYGRKNAFSIDFTQDPNDETRTVAEKFYLFTFVPSITYNIKF